MNKKKNFYLWVILFIFLTTFSFNSSKNSKKIFLPVNIINIEGIKNSNQFEIDQKLNQFKGKSIILISRYQMEKIVEGLEFVKEIKVKKKYPDTIKIIIFENEPIGIFKHENNQSLILDDGESIENFQFDKFNSLPLVYGKGAKENFHLFYKSLENTNFKIEKIKQFIYFGINRWDVILNDGKVVKLPAENYELSIKKFLSIYKKENFVNFKIFDFRIKGQLILK